MAQSGILHHVAMAQDGSFPLCLSQEIWDVLGYRKVSQLDLAWKQLESLSSRNLHGPRCTDTIETVSVSAGQKNETWEP